MRKLLLLFVLFGFVWIKAFAQTTFPVQAVKDKRPEVYLLKNATVFIDYQTKKEKTDILIKNGYIELVAENIPMPEGAILIDLKGKTIYPGLIDIYSNYGLPEVMKTQTGQERRNRERNYESTQKGAFNQNEAIKSWYNSVDNFTVDEKTAEEFRKLGFGMVLTFNQDGIARGTSALVSLADNEENHVIIISKATANYSFNKGTSKQSYPSSLMGSIALLRQTYYDALWYQQSRRIFFDISLEAWNQIQDLPQIFEVNDKLSLFRAEKVGKEFGIQYIIKGIGDEYQRIEDVKASGVSLIIPVNFPQIQNFDDASEAVDIPYENLKHWEMAPKNPAILAKNNISFAITSFGLKSKNEFWTNLRKSIKAGLNETIALKALTFNPAKMLRLENKIGAIKKGYFANFLITSGNLFDENTVIYENWIQGKKYKLNDIESPDCKGIYELKLSNNQFFKLEISGKANDYTCLVTYNDSVKTEGKISQAKNLVSFTFILPKTQNAYRLSGWISDRTIQGNGYLPDGTLVKWNAAYIKENSRFNQRQNQEKDDNLDSTKILYPFMPFGYLSKVKQQTILIKNATVWTNEKDGILTNTDILIENGKISKIGKNLQATNALIIDATNKYVTSGIIDEHSHIAVSGNVNEGTYALTPEVRIDDVINPEDINIYRQLAGGVTAAHILHGSANPVGGQSSIIKLKWGCSADEMRIKNTVGFLKHALGENVKQSNFQMQGQSRFPSSRMGVEQIILDAYTRAKDYMNEWENYNKLSAKDKNNAVKPRRDLLLDALVDVLLQRSFITCHSYVQSEAIMIMELANRFGIKVNTLIHNTDGYKVADVMKKYGVAGSVFSDWWDYKFEVYDGISYNAAMLLNQGILTCLHSDNAELARRLNQDAAKVMKYGNIDQETAFKLVTLNPAKILHLDDRMGSIKIGKDADLVVWSDYPMSVYAKAEKTIIEGGIYFDLDLENQRIAEIEKDRNRIINKLLKEKAPAKSNMNSRTNIRRRPNHE